MRIDQVEWHEAHHRNNRVIRRMQTHLAYDYHWDRNGLANPILVVIDELNGQRYSYRLKVGNCKMMQLKFRAASFEDAVEIVIKDIRDWMTSLGLSHE